MRIGILNQANRGPQSHNNARLIAEAKKRGAEAVVIDYRKTVGAIREYGRQLLIADRDGGLQPVEVDVMLPRIGKDFLAGMKAMDILASNGIPSTVTARGVGLAKDKFASLVELDKGSIPVPYTIAPTGRTPKNPKPMIELVHTNKTQPIIVKNLNGSKGKGVSILESRRSAVSVVESNASSGTEYLVQEFLRQSDNDERPTDIRIIVVDGKVITAMKRTASPEDGEFRANIDRGGIGEIYEPTPREAELAIRAGEIIGARIIGFDAMHSYRGTLATEVNVNPFFAIEQVTGANVAGAMIDLAINLAEQGQSSGVV
jgi:ribosomal protein S6--L-glutamate ligase